MKSFKEFITEAKQVGTLYHYTSDFSAGNILSNNKLKSKKGIISFTRDKNFHKDANDGGGKRNGVPTDVSFELDGDKLSNRHKTTPYGWKSGRDFDTRNGYFDEKEERVEGDIPKIKSYIKKIRVHLPIADVYHNQLESHGIPIEHTYK